ncbi:rCG57367 [Rattus norvegicus]|uniref:RCG57367 n=1 Tax=Rattus norvegicus TaxID=10116 RepID=A6JPF8_RAT|nr:rCG57367 [Rattus norvegicus]
MQKTWYRTMKTLCLLL